MSNRNIAFPDRMLEALESRANEDESGAKVPDLVRRAVAAYLGGVNMDALPAVVDDSDSIKVKFLTTAPCGPWQEAIDEAGTFVLSRHVAEELGYRDGDVIVRGDGPSMIGAGIPDRALILVRPVVNNRPPRRGQVTLVQIVTKDGEYQGTIKKWVSPTELLDGGDKPFALPAKTREVTPIAEAVGIISLL